MPDTSAVPNSNIGSTGRMDYSGGGNGVRIPVDPATGLDIPSSPVSSPTPAAPAGVPASSSMIVTSSPSRSNYADNTATMNKANATLSLTNNNSNSTLNTYRYIDKNGQSQTIQATDPNTAIASAKDRAPDSGVQLMQSQPITSATDTSAKNNDSQKNDDGSQVLTDSQGNQYNLPAGMDPTIGKQLHENELQAQTDVANAKTAVDAATALYQSDLNGTNPAAIAAANSIKAQFQTLIDQMTKKNAIILGSATANAARSGGLQYANDMTQTVFGNVVQAGLDRVSALTQRMTDAVLKSNMAYQSGDAKAMEASTKDYQATIQEGQKALMDLSTAVSNAVKDNNASIKAAQTAASQKITDDAKLATSNASSVVDSITKAGYADTTDPAVQEYLQNQADALGIPVATLQGAVDKQMQTNSTFELKSANTKSTIANRGKTKTAGTKSYAGFSSKPTASVITKVNAYLESIGASQADINKVNSDEVSFYKVYNAIPSTKTPTSVVPQ